MILASRLGFLALILGISAENYPSPHMVIVGPTGAGKSSLANALLGCDPRGNSDCMYGVCGGLDSCTKNTTLGSGLWLGVDDGFTIVDTPGFGDSDGSDNKLIHEMMEILDNELGSANVIVLAIDGSTPRFSSGLYDMLRQMSSIFGETWWDFMMVGVTKWQYDEASIDKRKNDCDFYGDPSDDCKNEAWFIRELSQQLQEKFEIERTLTFAFMDSFSQSGPNLNDKVQQQHWTEETNKLWHGATFRNQTFDFQTIDDVLKENALCKEENNRLNDIISEDIKQLKDNVTSLDNSLSDVHSTVEGNTAQITDMTENVDNLETLLEDFIHNQDVISVRGRWCAYQSRWATANSIVKYDRLTFSDTNMDLTHTGTPLNINTGVFTVPKSGLWRVSYSLGSVSAYGEDVYAWLYHNGNQIPESVDLFNAGDAYVHIVGGRELLLKAEEGDSITLRSGELGYANQNGLGLHNILKCVEFKAV